MKSFENILITGISPQHHQHQWQDHNAKHQCMGVVRNGRAWCQQGTGRGQGGDRCDYKERMLIFNVPASFELVSGSLIRSGMGKVSLREH